MFELRLILALLLRDDFYRNLSLSLQRTAVVFFCRTATIFVRLFVWRELYSKILFYKHFSKAFEKILTSPIPKICFFFCAKSCAHITTD